MGVKVLLPENWKQKQDRNGYVFVGGTADHYADPWWQNRGKMDPLKMASGCRVCKDFRPHAHPSGCNNPINQGKLIWNPTSPRRVIWTEPKNFDARTSLVCKYKWHKFKLG